MQRQYWRNGWDNVIAVADEFGQPGAPWDGGIKNYVYDTGSMTWVAETQPSGGGGGGDASAANQATQISLATSANTKLDTLHSDLSGVTDGTLDAFQVVSVGSFEPPGASDAVTVTYPSDTTEVYAYRTGGIGGSVVATITVIYVDNTKARVLSAVRT